MYLTREINTHTQDGHLCLQLPKGNYTSAKRMHKICLCKLIEVSGTMADSDVAALSKHL